MWLLRWQAVFEVSDSFWINLVFATAVGHVQFHVLAPGVEATKGNQQDGDHGQGYLGIPLHRFVRPAFAPLGCRGSQ